MKKIISKIFMVCLMIFGIVLVPTMTNRKIVNADASSKELLSSNLDDYTIWGDGAGNISGSKDASGNIVLNINNNNPSANYSAQFKQEGITIPAGRFIFEATMTCSKSRSVQIMIQQSGTWAVIKDQIVNLTANEEATVKIDMELDNEWANVLVGIMAGNVGAAEEYNGEHTLTISKFSLVTFGEETVPPAEGDFTVTTADSVGNQLHFIITATNSLAGVKARFDCSELTANGEPFVKLQDELYVNAIPTSIEIFCRKSDAANMFAIAGTGRVIWENGWVFAFTITSCDGENNAYTCTYTFEKVELVPNIKLGAQLGQYTLDSASVVDPSLYNVTTANQVGNQLHFVIEYENSLAGVSASFDCSGLTANGQPFVKLADELALNVTPNRIEMYCRKADAVAMNLISGTGKVVWENGYAFEFTVLSYESENYTCEYAIKSSVTVQNAVRFIAKIENIKDEDLANYSDVVITVKVGEVVKSYGATCVYKTVNSVNGITAISEEAYYSVITFTNVPDGTVFTVSAVAHGIEGTDDISTAENTFTLSGNSIV